MKRESHSLSREEALLLIEKLEKEEHDFIVTEQRPKVQEFQRQLLSLTEAKLRELLQQHPQAVLVIGGKSRRVTEVVLLALAQRLPPKDPLRTCIEQRVRLGDNENYRFYSQTLTKDLLAQPKLDALIKPGQHFIFLDDHTTTGTKGGLIKDWFKARGCTADFVALAQSKFAQVVTAKLQRVIHDDNFFMYLSKLSLPYAEDVKARIDQLDPAIAQELPSLTPEMKQRLVAAQHWPTRALRRFQEAITQPGE